MEFGTDKQGKDCRGRHSSQRQHYIVPLVLLLILMLTTTVAVSDSKPAQANATEPQHFSVQLTSLQAQMTASAVGHIQGQSQDPAVGVQHDHPAIPLRDGALCPLHNNAARNSLAAFPVWKGQYTNLAAVGTSNSNNSWLENLLFILSISLLGIGLTVLSKRPENQFLRSGPLNWRVQFSEED